MPTITLESLLVHEPVNGLDVKSNFHVNYPGIPFIYIRDYQDGFIYPGRYIDIEKLPENKLKKYWKLKSLIEVRKGNLVVANTYSLSSYPDRLTVGIYLQTPVAIANRLSWSLHLKPGINPYYLFVYLRSPLVFYKYLSHHLRSGKKERRLHKQALLSLPILLPTKKIETLTETLILKAYQNQDTLLIDEIIEGIEKYIEGNEKQAIQTLQSLI